METHEVELQEVHSAPDQRPHSQRTVSSTCFDGVYFNATVMAVSSFSRYILFHFSKLIVLVVFTTVHFSNPNQSNRAMLVPFILGSVEAFCYVCDYLYIRSRLKRVPENLKIAENFGHVRRGEESDFAGKSLEDLVSDTYDFANEATSGLSDDLKRKYEQTLSKSIVSMHAVEFKVAHFSLGVLHVLSLALIIYAIAVLAHNPDLDVACKVMGSLFIVFESLAKYEIILALLFCVIIPIVMLVACCCVCCCGKGRQSAAMPQIASVKYAPSLALQCEPECRICFQHFSPQEMIMILPCDKKHVFHKFCIEGWFKVSTTCPMCRKNLAVEPNNDRD